MDKSVRRLLLCGNVLEAFAKQAYDSKSCANTASETRHAE
jgi:hypothetical protein